MKDYLKQKVVMELVRENDGTVKFNGQDLIISVKINGTEYSCSKAECK